GRGGYATHKSLYGDALEALVGAIYLDKGFKECRKFILKRLINPHFDIDEIIQNNPNFKSMLIEWAQKENKSIKFLIIKELGTTHNKEFTAEVLLDDKAISSGTGSSKKKAEQSAAEKACELLHLKS
ncbi:MAG TPA: putative dsRNA-binding protein, partial [Cytophagaceae bacterium]